VPVRCGFLPLAPPPWDSQVSRSRLLLPAYAASHNPTAVEPSTLPIPPSAAAPRSPSEMAPCPPNKHRRASYQNTYSVATDDHQSEGKRTSSKNRRAPAGNFKGSPGKWHTLGALEHIWAHLGPCFRETSPNCWRQNALDSRQQTPLGVCDQARREHPGPLWTGRLPAGTGSDSIHAKHRTPSMGRFCGWRTFPPLRAPRAHPRGL